MANNTSGGNRINVPQAKGALDNMKYEIARELGVNLKQGYNGDLTSREAGYVGGYMVKRLIEQRKPLSYLAFFLTHRAFFRDIAYFSTFEQFAIRLMIDLCAMRK